MMSAVVIAATVIWSYIRYVDYKKGVKTPIVWWYDECSPIAAVARLKSSLMNGLKGRAAAANCTCNPVRLHFQLHCTIILLYCIALYFCQLNFQCIAAANLCCICTVTLLHRFTFVKFNFKPTQVHIYCLMCIFV